ncbi:DUF4118 domain-containing protein [Oleiagrimonas sp.]|jgi:two-component system sensor histidine kinase KdpD|uniref:DUF4118 domain-containing protein n=1 Tax=Oleiagrimonas sp. TaxID=2010330 RepID=UPI0026309869|nr:DUF4118 domain-containing protein [Oleiagrimonas sp.]MDA3913284.1 DUF4118 domain-containing protein [Oleiagrimonas sp.]
MASHMINPRQNAPRRGHLVAVAGPYVFATLVTAVAFGLAFVADRYVAVANLSLIFLTAVLAVAVRARMRVAAYAAVLCFLGYNFFFTPPRYTFTIDSANDVLTVGLFLVVALVCSRLATQLADKVASLRTAQTRALALRELGQRLSAGADTDTIRAAGVECMAQALGTNVTLLVRDAQDRPWNVSASAPRAPLLDTAERVAADFCDRLAEPAGYGTERAREAACWMLPLRVNTQGHGVLALNCTQGPLDPDHQNLALAMAQDVGQALERARLAEALEKARVESETERLRNALLSSVSHDLRSPLASMIGSAETLSSYDRMLPDGERRQLLDAIVGEGQRLDRYIQNLLDMTRLGHGELSLRRDWVDTTEIVIAAVARMRRLFPDQAVATTLPHSTILLYVHPALIEQALFNILENAAHVSPLGATVNVRAAAADGELRIEVVDHGPGIPPLERERIFDTFYSVARGDRGDRGTGLGLSICRGMVGAHGGRVEALPAEGGGSILRISLPLPETPEDEP